MNPTLLQLDREDVKEMALIHCLAFPESAWTKLGDRVVREYYVWHLLGPHPIVHATGAYVNGQFAGFCVSGVFNGSTSGFLSKNRGLLISRLSIKPWLIFDPVFFNKVRAGASILRRLRKNKKKPRVLERPTDSFGILAIAVDPARQGLGIGQLLMADAERAATENKFTRMDLTVNTQNCRAVRFYERLNWEKSFRDGKWSGVMVKQLSPHSKTGESEAHAATRR